MQGAGVLRKRNDIVTSLVLVETSSLWPKKLSIYDFKKARGQEPDKKEPENFGFKVYFLGPNRLPEYVGSQCLCVVLFSVYV